jgi:hypothetical protein
MKFPTLFRPAITLGSYGLWFFQRPVRLSIKEFSTHVHTIGVSGSGKSRFLAGLFLELYRRGLAATLIDPHGDLATLVLRHLIASGAFERGGEGYRRVMYLNLPKADWQEKYFPFNVLNSASSVHTTAQNVLEALRRAWPTLSYGNAPNFENLVLAGTFVLIHHQLPLPFLHDLLVDKAWRDRLLTTVPDELVVRFFRERYDRWKRDQPMLIESSLRRLFLLAFSPILRYSLAQRENRLQFREVFDGNRSLIINLALQDADARRLLGCLLTVLCEQGAFSRSDLPPQKRFNSHHLMIDEFSEFTAQSEESLSRILGLCRKYGLYVVMAHQTWSQTSDRLKGALQNAGIEVVFKLGRSDAEFAATILGRVNPLSVKHQVSNEVAVERSHPLFFGLGEQWESWIQALQDLKPQEAFLKKSDGTVIQMRTLSVKDPKLDEEKLKKVEDSYLTTYFRPKADIERELAALRKPPVSRTTRIRPLAAGEPSLSPQAELTGASGADKILIKMPSRERDPHGGGSYHTRDASLTRLGKIFHVTEADIIDAVLTRGREIGHLDRLYFESSDFDRVGDAVLERHENDSPDGTPERLRVDNILLRHPTLGRADALRYKTLMLTASFTYPDAIAYVDSLLKRQGYAEAFSWLEQMAQAMDDCEPKDRVDNFERIDEDVIPIWMLLANSKISVVAGE